jgi:hypothetical protein
VHNSRPTSERDDGEPERLEKEFLDLAIKGMESVLAVL